MKYQEYLLGDIKLVYMIEESTEHVSMILLPDDVKPCFGERRNFLKLGKNQCTAWDVGTLCHLSLRHHAQGNGAGNTLKYGQSTKLLRYKSQEKSETNKGINIITLLEAEEGYQVEHKVIYTYGEKGIEVVTTFINQTGRMITLDLLTSFSLDNLSPLQKDDAPYKLKLHRFQGGWSLEGKHREDTLENLNLESAWLRCFPESERYGVLGSHPAKRWFPFGCLEDIEHHIYWAAQIGCNSSWQMELSKDGDCYSLSGGLADSEFGGWWKNIPDGDSFTAPKAYLSVSTAGFWDVCQNITGMFEKYVDEQPEIEQDLPIIFNEWCTTWGKPSHESMVALAEKVKELPVAYMVIDAGWSKKKIQDGNPQSGNGTWEYNEKQFPYGMKELSRQLKKMGLLMGIWLEFEVTTEGSEVHSGVFNSMHLHRNGEIIQTGDIRRFWDFRKPEVIQYLREKVIRFLKENEIYYLKVDYNGSIGSGCDGAESLGEGLRVQMQAVYNFFRLIRREIPELVIENCASGGHRLEPMMMGITAMSSFSDAHECLEIPYIASNLQQLILPRQSQIWAVISPELSIQQIRYRLVSAMLGRFCLSGEVEKLDGKQWDAVKNAARFYRKISKTIKHGKSKLYRNSTNNQHHLFGAQVLLRTNGKECIVVYHAFANPPESITGEMPEGNWCIVDHFGEDYKLKLDQEKFKITPQKEWEAFAIYLKNNSTIEDE